MRLSSTKIVLLSLSALMLLGGIFAAANTFLPGEKVVFNPETASASIIQSTAELDSDNDGLKDWEESVWKTDKTNADSDNDGTSDGEEVALKRNPAKSGPNDTLEIPSAQLAASQKVNATEKLSADLFEEYLEARATNGNIDLTQAKFLQAVEFDKKLYTEYTLKDVKILTEENADLKLKYGNILVLTIYKYYFAEFENPLLLLQTAMEKNSEYEMQKVAVVAEKRGELLGELLKMEVPKSASILHLMLVNNISKLKTNIEGMSLMISDPIHGLASMNDYMKNIQDFTAITAQFEAYF